MQVTQHNEKSDPILFDLGTLAINSVFPEKIYFMKTDDGECLIENLEI